jgi:CMP-N,N'-diacetyllegionaminic acid synthase
MFKNKKILAVIPAREGSKMLPGKNIKELAGKPLLAWTIEEAKRSKYIDRTIFSSDSTEIINLAISFGCEAPFVRPKELAGDDVLGIDPFIHAVKMLPKKYDYAVLLQCTSPLRRGEDIDSAIACCINNNASSCISVYETESGPYKMQTIDAKGRLRSIMSSELAFSPRQKLPRAFQFNGAIYMVEVSRLLEAKKLLYEDTLAYVMDKENSLDIDDELDFDIAEMIISKRRSNHG